MKTKIIDAIKRLFPGVNLSNKWLNAFADKHESKFTDENLDEKLKEFDDVMDFKEIAKGEDRVRTLEANQKPKPDDKPTLTPTPKPDDVETDPLKIIMNELKEMKTEIAGFKAKESQQTIAQTIKSNEKLKDIPESFYKRGQPTKPEEVEAFVEDVVKDYADFKQSNSELGNHQPQNGKPIVIDGKAKPASKEEVDAVMSKIKI